MGRVSFALGLRCLKCEEEYPLGKMFEGCPKCKTDKIIANLEVTYDYKSVTKALTKEILESRKGENELWKYKELLPLKDEQYMITLGEGDTPLIKCERLGAKIGLKNLYVKDESRNPTWSFKDRYSCVAVAKALEFKAKIVSVSSYGNMGASVAAYAAKADLSCVVFVPSFVPKNMLTWLQVYGAKIVPVTTTEGRWVLESRCVKTYDWWYPVGTFTSVTPVYNPYGVEGLKTLGYEICEQLKWKVPNRIIVPTAYGGGLWGIWKAFNEFKKLGFIEKEPRMISVEPTVLAPLAKAVSKGLEYVEKVPIANSVAFSIAGTISSYQALRAIRDSKGTALMVSEEEIIDMQKLLASTEGIYGEMASVATLAGAKKLREEGQIEKDEIIVCVITSSGLKFLELTAKFLQKPPKAIEPKWDSFKNLMRQYNIDLDDKST